MKLKFVLSIVSIVILLFAGCIDKDTGDKSINTTIPTDTVIEVTPIRVTDTPIIISKTVDWCKIGESIKKEKSIERATGVAGLNFKIKGLATYKDKEVCMAESSTDVFKFAYYFNEDNSYRIILATDPNGNTDEINIS